MSDKKEFTFVPTSGTIIVSGCETEAEAAEKLHNVLKNADDIHVDFLEAINCDTKQHIIIT